MNPETIIDRAKESSMTSIHSAEDFQYNPKVKRNQVENTLGHGQESEMFANPFENENEELETENDKNDLTVQKPRSTKKVRAPQPPSLNSSLSTLNLVGPTEKIVQLTPITIRKHAIGSDELVLTGFGQLEVSEDNKDEDDGKVLYQSQGYQSM